VFNVLDNVRLLSSAVVTMEGEKTYMLDFSHDFHLHVYLLIKNTVLHETSLLELLRGEGNAIKLGCNLIDDGKGAFPNTANFVIFCATFPLLNISSNRRGRALSSDINSRKEIWLRVVSSSLGTVRPDITYWFSPAAMCSSRTGLLLQRCVVLTKKESC
jgi:hypothetical protein